MVFLSITEIQADLAYIVGRTFGEAFDSYLNDNNNAPTKTMVCFEVFLIVTPNDFSLLKPVSR